MYAAISKIIIINSVRTDGSRAGGMLRLVRAGKAVKGTLTLNSPERGENVLIIFRRGLSPEIVSFEGRYKAFIAQPGALEHPVTVCICSKQDGTVLAYGSNGPGLSLCEVQQQAKALLLPKQGSPAEERPAGGRKIAQAEHGSIDSIAEIETPANAANKSGIESAGRAKNKIAQPDSVSAAADSPQDRAAGISPKEKRLYDLHRLPIDDPLLKEDSTLGDELPIAEYNYFEKRPSSAFTQNQAERQFAQQTQGSSPTADALPGGGFYQSIEQEFLSLFARFPKEPVLEKRIRNSRFVKINYNDTDKYYAVGIVEEDSRPKYICYAVPAKKTSGTPEGLEGFCQFMPASLSDPQGEGYFLMVQSAKTGRTLSAFD